MTQTRLWKIYIVFAQWDSGRKGLDNKTVEMNGPRTNVSPKALLACLGRETLWEAQTSDHRFSCSNHHIVAILTGKFRNLNVWKKCLGKYTENHKIKVIIVQISSKSRPRNQKYNYTFFYLHPLVQSFILSTDSKSIFFLANLGWKKKTIILNLRHISGKMTSNSIKFTKN